MRRWFIALLLVLLTLVLYYFTGASRAWFIFLSASWGVVIVLLTWLLEINYPKSETTKSKLKGRKEETIV